MKADLEALGPFPACALADAPERPKKTEIVLPFEAIRMTIDKAACKLVSGQWTGELGDSSDSTTMDLSPPVGMEMLYKGLLGLPMPAPPKEITPEHKELIVKAMTHESSGGKYVSKYEWLYQIHPLTALRVLYDLLVLNPDPNRTLCQNKNGNKQTAQWILQSRATHFVLSFVQKLSHDETLETTSSAGNGNPSPFSMATMLLGSFVLRHPSLAQEFVHANGLGILCGEKASLSDYVHRGRAHICVNMLVILSHLSRMSKEYYPAIHKLGIYRELAALLRCPDANIRAKTAHVVGNMCRHSDFFYAKLRETGILANLIPLCGDTDATTRQFASFAVGNSAFHSNMLYPQLKGAVAPLRDLLLLDGKNNEKCRAIAAGALGNLVRHSSELCEEIVRCGVLGALFDLTGYNRDEGTISLQRAEADSSVTALFSLGNMAVHPTCKQALTELDVERFAQCVARARRCAQPENLLHRQAQRLLQKFGMH
eukprot:g17187.t1